MDGVYAPNLGTGNILNDPVGESLIGKMDAVDNYRGRGGGIGRRGSSVSFIVDQGTRIGIGENFEIELLVGWQIAERGMLDSLQTLRAPCPSARTASSGTGVPSTGVVILF